jgi:hypothetical protein
MNSLKVPGELVAAFEDLILDTKAIEAKYSHFVAAIHNEQKAVAVKARELWKETRSVMNLPQGVEYNYNDGELYPVDRVPNAPDINPAALPIKLGL